MCQSVWPYLAKFLQFVQNITSLGKILTVNFLFGKLLSLLWRICYIIWQFFTIANGLILKNNPTIWSHWCREKILRFQPVFWMVFPVIKEWWKVKVVVCRGGNGYCLLFPRNNISLFDFQYFKCAKVETLLTLLPTPIFVRIKAC